MTRAGQTGASQHVFHARLVAEIACRVGAQPLDTQGFASHGERHLQLLENADIAFRFAVALTELLRRLDELRRVERIGNAPVTGDPALQILRQRLERLLANDREVDAGKIRRAADKAQGRVHAKGSRKYDVHR